MTPIGIKNNLWKKNYQHNALEEFKVSIGLTAPITCPEKSAVLSPASLHAVTPPRNVFQEHKTAQEPSVSGRENILQMSNLPFSCEAWRCLVLPILSHKYGSIF